MIDDFCKGELLTEPKHPGPQATLSRREVLTLVLFWQWTHFPSEQAFYRYAVHHCREAFPSLPDRSQFID